MLPAVCRACIYTMLNGDYERMNTCWPRRQAIWEWLTREPLAPVTVISDRQLAGKGFTCPNGRHACGQPQSFIKVIFPAALEYYRFWYYMASSV